jgi:hypothetical protein
MEVHERSPRRPAFDQDVGAANARYQWAPVARQIAQTRGWTVGHFLDSFRTIKNDSHFLKTTSFDSPDFIGHPTTVCIVSEI